MVFLPVDELEWSFVRSSGKGGQNVNKVNSKALLRWHVLSSRSFSQELLLSFCQYFSNKISKDGYLSITSEKFRDQGKNVKDCLEKLRVMLDLVLIPKKKRVSTKPTKSSVKRRLQSKKRHQEKKVGRKKVGYE